MISAARIIRTSLTRAGIRFLKNPETFLVRHYINNVFKQGFGRGGMRIISGTMCGYKARCTTPTSFLFWGPRSGEIVHRRCHRKICEFPRARHVALSSTKAVTIAGTNSSKCFGAKKGQVYPDALVKDLMTQLFGVKMPSAKSSLN